MKKADTFLLKALASQLRQQEAVKERIDALDDMGFCEVRNLQGSTVAHPCGHNYDCHQCHADTVLAQIATIER